MTLAFEKKFLKWNYFFSYSKKGLPTLLPKTSDTKAKQKLEMLRTHMVVSFDFL